eukprot:COSAG06_NODE_4091_length_4584_cov_18.280936_7_plen_45_part_01
MCASVCVCGGGGGGGGGAKGALPRTGGREGTDIQGQRPPDQVARA